MDEHKQYFQNNILFFSLSFRKSKNKTQMQKKRKEKKRKEKKKRFI